jgi:hypothetical protein
VADADHPMAGRREQRRSAGQPEAAEP